MFALPMHVAHVLVQRQLIEVYAIADFAHMFGVIVTLHMFAHAVFIFQLSSAHVACEPRR